MGECEATTGGIERTVTEVSEVYDVTICSMGAYPSTDSGLVRTLAVSYAASRGFLTQDPAVTRRAAKLRAAVELRRRRLTSSA